MMRIPTVTKNLLIINVLAFFAMYVLRSVNLFGGSPVELNDVLGLHFFLAPDFHIYQLVTYMFMHANFTHIFFNMFALWMFGMIVERTWGAKRFLFYYISCGIGAGLFQELAQFCDLYFMLSSQSANVSIMHLPEVARQALNAWTTVGASGSIYGVLLAFGMLFPNEKLFIIPIPFPIKAKWFVMIYAGIELFSAMATAGDGVAHIAHLGGMVVGFFMIKYWRSHAYRGSNMSDGNQFFDNLKRKWDQRGNKKKFKTWHNKNTEPESYNSHNNDWDYNARKKAEQDEIDRILDKIRKSGYDSLSADEKRCLFESSKKN